MYFQRHQLQYAIPSPLPYVICLIRYEDGEEISFASESDHNWRYHCFGREIPLKTGNAQPLTDMPLGRGA